MKVCKNTVIMHITQTYYIVTSMRKIMTYLMFQLSQAEGLIGRFSQDKILFQMCFTRTTFSNESKLDDIGMQVAVPSRVILYMEHI